MPDFEMHIRAVVESYQGKHPELVSAAPELYQLLTRILEDPELPGRLRPLVLVSIAYFFLPTDIISEDLSGPRGYQDDIFLAALVFNQVRLETGGMRILERHWTGSTPPIRDLIEQILDHEKDLIGDQRDVLLWYIGSEHLPGFR